MLFQGTELPLNTPATTYLPFLDKSFDSGFGSPNESWLDATRAEPYQLPVSPIDQVKTLCPSHAKAVITTPKCCSSGCNSSGCWKPPRRFSQGRISKARGELLLRRPDYQEHVKNEMEICPEAQPSFRDGTSGTSRDTQIAPIDSHGETPVTRIAMKRNSSSQYEEPVSKKSSTDTSQISSDNVSISSSSLVSPSNASKSSSSQALDEDSSLPTRQAKASHCQVERKYRENLNTKFEILRRAIPSMQSPTDDPKLQGPDLEDIGNSTKPRKADVLSSATSYVMQMEEKNRVMGDEIQFLRSRVTSIEKLIKCEDCWLLNGVQGMHFDPHGGNNHEDWMKQSPD